MNKYLYFIIIALSLSSCSYTVYDMNRGELKIAHKNSYQVEYMADVPAGTTAVITYRGENNVKYIEQRYTGKLDKVVTLPAGQPVKFTVDVKLPKTTPASKLTTFIKVEGEIITEQVQTGKNVKYRFEFKLP